MAERYCRNCGQELGQEVRFCPNCGQPVQETAHVPTPEANVPVPPPPGAQQTETMSGGRSAATMYLMGCLGVVAVLVLVVVIGLAALGGGGGAGQSDRGGGSASNPEEEPGASEDQYSGDVDTFTRENYGILVANPNEHKGAKVNVTGQLLDGPEKRGSEVAFQMWADPVKVDWNTLVRTGEESLGLRGEDYVRVTGTVLGSFEGENAFGGGVSAVEIDADEVERVEAVEAVDPTQETVEVGQTQSSEGFSVTLQRLEFGRRHTRAFISARNEGEKTAKLDLYRAKIIQGEDRAGQTDPYEYNVPKPKSGLPTGESTEGVVIFGHADPTQPLQVSFAWERGGFMGDKPEPLIFEVTP